MHIGDARVQAEGIVAAAERPQMHIVDFLDTLDLQDSASHVFDTQIKRAAFQENVRGLAQNADAGPEHEQTDGEAEKRINPVRIGSMDNQRAGDDGDIGTASAPTEVQIIQLSTTSTGERKRSKAS